MRLATFRFVAFALVLLVIAPVLVGQPAPAAAQGSCGTAPAPRLGVGQSARVTMGDGTGNNLRQSPSTTATVMGVMGDGEIFSVIGGPQCVENFWWWQVRRWDGQMGWTAEGQPGKYWVEPWPVAGAQLVPGNRPDLPNVWIAYLSGSTVDNITLPYVMQANGTSALNIGTVQAHDNVLRWSPDGTRIAMSDGKDIFILAASGGAITNLTNTPAVSDYWPTWSPDGMRVAYAADANGNVDIFSQMLTGGAPVNLTHDPAVDNWPAWSPDGTRIAFGSNRDGGNMDIYVMSAADGANPVRLTTGLTADSEPVWSPDGRQIAFVSSQGSKSDLFVINADGSGLTALTDNALGNRNPVWSPDSQRIAYIGGTLLAPGADAVFSVRRDGTDRMQYTVGPGQMSGVSWSPDGQWLAFSSNPNGTFDIFTIRSNGAGLANLTNSPSFNDTWPTWQPATAPGVVTTPGGTPVATAPAVNPGAEDLLLIYNTSAPSFTLQNVSGKPVNLFPLSFSGGGVTVSASVWSEFSSSPLASFKPGGCLMLWPFGIPDQPAPPECGDARQGWVANARMIFWTQGSFTVTYNGAAVATCETAADRCTVDLP
jgi:Tol biopolymer transport system component